MVVLKIKKGVLSYFVYNLCLIFFDVEEVYMLVVFVINESGVLVWVIGFFLGCGYNIESFMVVEVDYIGYILCIIIVIKGKLQIIEQIKIQFGCIVFVYEVYDLIVEGLFVECEFGLFKVVGEGDKCVEVMCLVDIFCVNVVDMMFESFVFEFIGVLEKIDVFVDFMCLFGFVEVVCIGVVVFVCGVY